MKPLWEFLRRKISIRVSVYLILSYLIMYFVLVGIELVVRGTSVEVLRRMILIGVVTGWLLGRSSIKFWQALLISVFSGIVLTMIHIGGIDAALWNLIKAAFRNLWNLVFHNIVLDAGELNFLLEIIRTRVQEIFSGLLLWGSDLITGFYIYNQVSTLLTWGYVLWLLSSWITWVTFRDDQPIWGLIPQTWAKRAPRPRCWKCPRPRPERTGKSSKAKRPRKRRRNWPNCSTKRPR